MSANNYILCSVALLVISLGYLRMYYKKDDAEMYILAGIVFGTLGYIW